MENTITQMNKLIDSIKYNFKHNEEKELLQNLESLNGMVAENEDIFNDHCTNYPFTVSFDEVVCKLEESENILHDIAYFLESNINLWNLSK